MKKLLLILLCLPFIGLGQIWEKTYGGSSRDDGYFVQQTSDGGFIMCGRTNSFGNGGDDVYTIKTDLNGVEEWSQTYGGTGTEFSSDIKQTSDGGYIICGSIFNVGFDVYLIKIDLNGNVVWTQTYGGSNMDYAKSVEQTNDGGYIICGRTNSFGNGGYEAYLIKTNLNGVEEWSLTYSGTVDGNCIKQTIDGGYIILADVVVGTDHEIQLIKTDLNGVEEWSQIYGGAGLQQSNYVQQTNDGGYIVLGSTDNPAGILFFKLNSNGFEEWSRQFNGGYPGSCQQTTDGGFIICGTNEDTFPDTDFYLIKTDWQGTSHFEITSRSNKKLEIVINLLGIQVNNKKNQPIFYIYDDGTIEKRITID